MAKDGGLLIDPGAVGKIKEILKFPSPLAPMKKVPFATVKGHELPDSLKKMGVQGVVFGDQGQVTQVSMDAGHTVELKHLVQDEYELKVPEEMLISDPGGSAGEIYQKLVEGAVTKSMAKVIDDMFQEFGQMNSSSQPKEKTVVKSEKSGLLQEAEKYAITESHKTVHYNPVGVLTKLFSSVRKEVAVSAEKAYGVDVSDLIHELAAGIEKEIFQRLQYCEMEYRIAKQDYVLALHVAMTTEEISDL